MKYIGIDPGKKGGIAILHEDGSLELKTFALIGTEVDPKSIYEAILPNLAGEHIAGLEDVHSIHLSSAGSNFEFGRIKGVIEGILVASQASYLMVAPKTWQKIAWQGIPAMFDSKQKKDTKAMSALAARRLFPKETFLATSRSSVPHDGLIDAALIAYWLKIHTNGGTQ